MKVFELRSKSYSEHGGLAIPGIYSLIITDADLESAYFDPLGEFQVGEYSGRHRSVVHSFDGGGCQELVVRDDVFPEYESEAEARQAIDEYLRERQPLLAKNWKVAGSQGTAWLDGPAEMLGKTIYMISHSDNLAVVLADGNAMNPFVFSSPGSAREFAKTITKYP